MIVFLIYVLVISAGKVTTQTEFSQEALPEIEFQPFEEGPLNESTVQEVSARPLPAEPLNPQVVISENETGIKPSQNVSSVSVPPVHRHPLPVGGTSLGNETQIPESPLIEPECHKALDLGFLMDSSYTISPSLWEQEKSMVVTLLDKMDVSPLGTHMSVMTFSTEVEFPIPFNGYNDVDDLKRKITVLPYHTGWSRTDLGLTAVKERMFDHDAGARDAKRVPRALVVFTNGKTDGSSDQNLNWTQMVSEAADDLKHARIKVFGVEIGDALLQDMTQIASDSSSVFSQTNLDGVLKELVDMGAETCSSEDYPERAPLPLPYMMYPPTPAPYFAPHPAQYPTPQPAVNQLAQYPAAAAAVPAGSCQIPQCTYPSICITAAIYQTCIAPTTTVPPNSTCATPGQCLTTRTIIATDTTTVTDTKTQIHVLTNTHYTTKTSTALLTSHVPVTATKTLTTTSVGVVNATNTQTLTSTAVVMSTAVETSTAVVTSTSHSTETSTAVETSTAIATSTAVVTATTTSTNIAKSTQVATSTKVTTATSTLITTSTGVTTSTHHTTATNTNTVNTTHFATETLTKTLTTTATHRTTITHNSTNLITATATSTAIATSTALLTSTSIAKTTETLTATSTAIQTQTLTNTINQILTQTQTLTATSTAVVTTCSFNCSTIGPTPSFSSTPPPEAESSASITTPPPPTPPECKRALDLGLVIDSSDSINYEDYQSCLDFVSNLTTSFMVSQSATHFGAIVFSSTPILQFNFADAKYYKRKRLRKAIKKFPYLAEGTRTDLALSLASKELFSIQGGDRPSVPNVLIVITDGRTNPQSSRPYPEVLQPLKKKYVTILAVGVGAQVDRAELKTIALNESSHVFMVERYTDLTQILKSLSDESCNETLRGHPPTLEPVPILFSSPTNEKPTPSFSSTSLPEAESSVSITTPPPPTPPECKRALDLGLVIDSSESINYEDYQSCLDFVSNLTTSFMVSQSATHFGAIVFSSTPILQFNFADAKYYKRKRLRKAIKKFPYLAEGTRTDLALSLASKELFSIQGGDRPSVPNVLIVITDGRTNPQSSRPYPEVLQPLKKKYVTILAVGVGAQVDRAELKTIALNDSSHVFMIERYTDLTQILKSLSDESCNETLIAHPPTLEPAPFLFSSPTNENLLQPLESDQQVQSKVGLYGNCPVHFTKKGCFNDLRNPRPLRKLMFTDLDENAVKYSGFPVDWGRFDSYLEDVACRCAQVSKAKGFTHFGIEDFGECWSGKDSGRVYNKDGLSRFCITKEFAQCNANDRNACSGNKTTIFVYSIPENYEAQQAKACFTQYKNIGCYADKQLSPRPIPDLIFTDLDKDSPKYSGNEARLGELDTYLSDVLCRCAEQAQELGYKFFGVQNHGECYSGPKVEISYNKDGPSNQCITRNFRECDRGNLGNPKDCVGTQGANYVYRIIGVKS